MNSQRCMEMVRAASLLLPMSLIAAQLALAVTPAFMEETARIASPDAKLPLNGPLAVDGSFLIATSTVTIDGAPRHVVYLFARRSASSWALVRKLLEFPGDIATAHLSLDMSGGVAAISAGPWTHIFEFAGDDWSRTAIMHTPETASTFISDTAVSPGFVVVGTTAEGRFGGYVYERNASGQWLPAARLDAGLAPTNVNIDGPQLDVSLNYALPRIAIGSPNYGEGPIQDVEDIGKVYLFQRSEDGGWRPLEGVEVLFGPDATRRSAEHVALADILAFSRRPASAIVWEDMRDPSQPTWWLPWYTSSSPDELMNGVGIALDASGDRYALGEPHDEDRGAKAGSVTIYDQQFDAGDRAIHRDPYLQKVKLLASNARAGLELGRIVSFSGDRIAAGSTNGVYVFELDRAPQRQQRISEDLEDGIAQGWQAQTPTWSIVRHNDFRVYRQTSTTGETRSLLSSADWTNQAIHVDVRPLAFNGADRWAAILARYTDEANHYALRMRGSNRVEIVRRWKGATKILGSAPLSFPANVNQRVRFEVIGSWLRAYVGGRRVLQARDTALKHGAFGLKTFWTRAQYDNIVISDTPAVVLQYDNFEDGVLDDHWVGPHWVPPAAQIVSSGSNRVLMHSGERELFTLSGGPYNPGWGELWDQIIECRVRPVAYGAGDAAFGVVARFMNEGMMIYVRASADGRISLISRSTRGEEVLDSATVSIPMNQWQVLRIEATGLELRVYLNGRFVLQGSDPSPQDMGGRYGTWTNNALVHFDNFLAQLP